MALETLLENLAALIFIVIIVILSFYFPYFTEAQMGFNPRSIPLTALALSYSTSTPGDFEYNVTVYRNPEPLTNFRIVEGGFSENTYNFAVEYGIIHTKNFLIRAIEAAIIAAINTLSVKLDIKALEKAGKFKPGTKASSDIITKEIFSISSAKELAHNVKLIGAINIGSNLLTETYYGYYTGGTPGLVRGFVYGIKSSINVENGVSIVEDAIMQTATFLLTKALALSGIGTAGVFVVSFLLAYGEDLIDMIKVATSPYIKGYLCSNINLGDVAKFYPVISLPFSYNMNFPMVYNVVENISSVNYQEKSLSSNSPHIYYLEVCGSNKNFTIFYLTGECNIQGNVTYPKQLNIIKKEADRKVYLTPIRG